ncbi:MAG: polyhydroxybutyrate depolymerase [Pseudomonadota bacterium]
MSFLVLAFIGSFPVSTGAAHACGPDTDCVMGERTYRIAMPPDAEGPVGAIVFMHGWRGTAAGVMNNGGLRDMAAELGVALIAPKSGGEDWLIRNAPRKGFTDDHRELEFFDAMLDDADSRFGIDRDKLLATGFSAGGMMTWTLACHRGTAFTAFAPVAGTFWADIPQDCPNPAIDLVHFHGTADEVVPLGGRPIADTRQGDVYAALIMMREAHDYGEPLSADKSVQSLDCEGGETAGGDALMLCLHDGGHTVKAEWIEWAFKTFVAP